MAQEPGKFSLYLSYEWNWLVKETKGRFDDDDVWGDAADDVSNTTKPLIEIVANGRTCLHVRQRYFERHKAVRVLSSHLEESNHSHQPRN